jgi:VCBS repeat-containing protein
VPSIVTENQLTGTPQSVWSVGTGNTTIQGFATDISVDQGQTVNFKINDSANAPYHIDIYRLGYYQGNGARLVATINSSQTLRQVQPSPLTDAATGLVDAGNWAVSASWSVPTTATSGLYFARLTRDDTGGASAAYFVVRDDDGGSDLLFQTSDSTWQAYNSWGGNSLYTGSPAGRAYKVSYNRPLTIDSVGGGLGDYSSPLHAEYPMIRWLEANGYNVSYSTDVDTDRRGTELLEHKVFLSVGHDEYWSGGQRSSVEAARDAGVNLAFFSGNEGFWKTRWENSIDASGTPYRTLVCYKESKANAKIDPSPVWTGTWRDARFSPPADGGRPESALSGTAYMDDRTSVDLGIPMTVSASDAGYRFWRNTSVANLTGSQTATLGQFIVGYEVDEDVDNGFRPAGLMTMSSTTFSTAEHVISPWGTDVGPGTGNHKITLYRAASGALVFGAGTIQWSWGLDGTHNNQSTTPSVPMQQATVNLFADMGAQPGSLQTGMVAATASTDHTAPTSMITSPASGSNFTAGSAVTVTGAAADSGGIVGGAEVSVDGGATWHPATGRSSWSYTWVPAASGSITIKSRSVDDSGNLEAPGAGVTVNVSSAVSNATLWAPAATPVVASANDSGSYELGVKFRSDIAGYVTGVRFYKGAGNTGTHVGHLWTASGTLLASVTFTSETASGWQQVDFAQPVSVQADTTYVISYFVPNGHYSVDSNYFASAGVDSGVLHALSSPAAGGNGVFLGGSSGFPTSSFNSSNYWVDVVFNQTVALTVTAKTPAPDSTGVSAGSGVTVTFSRAMDPTTVNGSTFRLRAAGAGSDVPATVTYSGLTATLQPNTNLAPNTTYQVTVSGGMAAADGTPLGSDTTWSFTTQQYPTLTDTTAVDFGAGTLDAGVALVQTGDGEAVLRPTAGSEFSGTALPADWTSTPWNTGGASTVSGGRMTVDGASARTATLYAPGRSLEFVATFSTDAFQHVGFADDFSSNLWAEFSTGSGGALYARTAGPGGSFDTQLATSLLGGPHIFRINWTATGTTYFVDGTQVASHNLAVTNSMRPVASDFNTGGGAATIDWMRMTPYAPSGTFLSRVLDAGGSATWVDAAWAAGSPSGTSLALSVRMGNTPTPDGTWTDFISLANSGAAIGGVSRYLQYRAVLATTNPDQTPTLQSLTFQYRTNAAPVANNDAYGTNEDTALTVNAPGVLGNDTDADGNALTAVLVSGPAHGTLTFNANGSFTYTPAANYNGSDSFTYKANDGQADSNTATVSITVTPVNDAPVAANDSYTTAEDTALTVNAPGVLGNDSDVDSPSLTAVLVAGPSHGTLTLNANGSFTYTPSANYNGSDSFTYKANDGSLDSNTATVSLTITPVNDAPAAANDTGSLAEDTVLTVNAPGVLGNDSDIDSSSLTAVLVSGPSHGTLTLNSNGSFTYTPAANYNGSDSFTYKANDGNLDSNTATVSLTITPVNDSPVAVNDSYTTAEDTALTVSAPGVRGNDTDVDGDTLTAVLVSGPAHGTLTFNSNGSFTYTPAANYNGSDSFTYKVNDGALDSNTATVSLTVTAVNDAPVAANNSYTTPEETALNVSAASGVLGNDTDVDGDTLTAVLVSGPSHGTLTLNANGSFTYTPGAQYNGPDSFTYKARDPSGALSGVATVTLTVTPPTVSISNVSANEGGLLASTPFNFTVSLSSATSRTITMNYATADGTATAGLSLLGGDYTATSGTLTFAGGQTSRTISVTVSGDISPESNETFFVNLSGASTPISDNQGLGTIVNDDSGLLLRATEADVGTSEATLTPPALAPIVAEATARWAATGMDTAVLSNVDIRIADLPDIALGVTTAGVIYIDVNAAGHGWFIDPTPADDKEFATPADPATLGRVDLLTVVTHEMGHALGLEHSATGVMQETLVPGVRHPLGCGCPACAAALSAPTCAAVAPPSAVTASGPVVKSPDGNAPAVDPVNAIGFTPVEKPALAFVALDTFNGWDLSLATGSPAHSANFRTDEPNAGEDPGVSKERDLSQSRDPAAGVIQRVAFTDPGVIPDRFSPVVEEWDSTGFSSVNESPASEK